MSDVELEARANLPAAIRAMWDRASERVRSGAIAVPEGVARTATSAGSYGTPVTE